MVNSTSPLEIRRTWVCDYNALCSAGNNPSEIWENVAAKNSMTVNGLGTFQMQALELTDKTLAQKLPENIRHSKAALAFLKCLEPLLLAQDLREIDFLILATTTGLVGEWEAALMGFLNQTVSSKKCCETFRYCSVGTILKTVCECIGYTGQTELLATACAAGTQALGFASSLIQTGRANTCLVVGLEVLTQTTLQGFESLRLRAHEPCRPFDKNRQGINLADAAACILLSSKKPNHKNPIHLSGYGYSSDAHHMTAPHPDGEGSFQSIQMALKRAKLKPSDIDLIYAHGTGTVHNDLSEAKAFTRVFNDHPTVPVCSTKSVHGHALGASGVLEAVVALEALKNQTLIPTTGFHTPDPQIHGCISQAAEKKQIQHILRNTAGFGGSNASIIFSLESSL